MSVLVAAVTVLRKAVVIFVDKCTVVLPLSNYLIEKHNFDDMMIWCFNSMLFWIFVVTLSAAFVKFFKVL